MAVGSAEDADLPWLDQLAADLAPVRPLDDGPARWQLAGLVGAAAVLVALALGLRTDLVAGQPDLMFLLRCGSLAVLALVCTLAALDHAHPGVGRSSDGWKVAILMAGLLPLAGLAQAVMQPDHAIAMAAQPSGWQCLMVSLGIASLAALPIIRHLRRGAPVAPERAGLLVGLSAGSLGALAYNVHCPFNSLAYIGLWYGSAVAIATVAGRLIVPRLVRW
ncbi:hypothetical protein CAP39_04585 [Sphingomonas sp. IBVSS1]|uniref:DUF1109 domain-containing protein n=1 Tax=Sandarakinorhabdus cyanobacteriorum TaxID=1981098 RepID=A0A255YB53_9SPHN|nr:DUF1109 domain-containing protein [Sandarakinorhabdus cyanobacteriorum]OSZ72603.1 hypothetical protein CAP39_04585 [Sphingomonas sp. IBVSS1]OYQ25690.1 DUF1109 domain-containing protein [Sandarakinorhabdus cyanobacteriorum]